MCVCVWVWGGRGARTQPREYDHNPAWAGILVCQRVRARACACARVRVRVCGRGAPRTSRPDMPVTVRSAPSAGAAALATLVHATSPAPVQSMMSMSLGLPSVVVSRPGAPGSTPVSRMATARKENNKHRVPHTHTHTHTGARTCTQGHEVHVLDQAGTHARQRGSPQGSLQKASRSKLTRVFLGAQRRRIVPIVPRPSYSGWLDRKAVWGQTIARAARRGQGRAWQSSEQQH